MGLINLVHIGTSQKYKSGWLEGLWSRQWDTSLFWCVGNVDARVDRSCEGVLSSVDELTSLAVLPVHCLNSLITHVLAWLCLVVFGLVCVILGWIS